MENVLKIVLILALVTAAQSADAFGPRDPDSAKKPSSESTSTQPSANRTSLRPPAGAIPQHSNLITGKVVETMTSGGYTYINIEKDSQQTWVAVPKTEVKVGQEVSAIAGMAMPQFESKSLKRTFDSITFSPGLVSGAPADPAAPPQASSTPVSFTPEKISVEKASGPDAYTVAELYDKKSALEKKNVVVRGKVVKVSSGIMNTNWIHIQDGSGDVSKGTNDLLITSDDIPSVGDIVTATGTLVNDKDIGSGYKFAVMIEAAKISK